MQKKNNPGYIKVNRGILNSPMYQDGNPFDIGKVLFDLNLRAFFNEVDKPYRNKMEHFQKGQVEGSIRQMKQWWNLSEKTILNRLKELEKSGYIYKNIVNGRTVITLVNYRAEQDNFGFDYNSDSNSNSNTEYNTYSNSDSNSNSHNYKNDKECIKNDKKMNKNKPAAFGDF